MGHEIPAILDAGKNKKSIIRRVLEPRILSMAQRVREQSSGEDRKEIRAKILDKIRTRALELVPEA
jgi:hypothetical protein